MKSALVWLAAAAIALSVGEWIVSSPPRLAPATTVSLATATFAGGCYWCMQPAFDHLPGVVSVTAGFAGDGEQRREAVEIAYDPGRITYAQLLGVFWRNIDPLNDAGQFCDDGSDYRSGIFTHDAEQETLAEAMKQAIEARKGIRIVTAIVPAGSFSRAADYDQNYYRKHPVRYRIYRLNCGRDARLFEVWGAAH